MDTAQINRAISILPASIKAALFEEEGRILLTLHEPQRSLHFDGGAFEGWILMLHVKLPRMQLVLDIPALEPARRDKQRFCRLLYRVHHFNRMGYRWFSLGEQLRLRTEDFMRAFYGKEKRLAAPAEESRPGDRGEKILQRSFSSDTSILRALPECDNHTIHEDLPLHLYWGAKKSDLRAANRIFPGGQRYVDLWCVKDDQLNIFELKYQNRQMGVVAELFFYACLCRDLLFDPEVSKVLHPDGTGSYRGVEDFYIDGSPKPFHRINAWFLVDKFHPALDAEYVCEMLSTKELVFQVLRYSYDMPMSFYPQEAKPCLSE